MKEGIDQMQQVIEFLEMNLTYIVLILLGFVFISLVVMIMILVKYKKLKKAYKKFMTGNDGNMEDLLQKCLDVTNAVEGEHALIKSNITNIQSQLEYCTQKVGVIRYNAIHGVGADLCFALALLDNKNNGVVINGIYTRDGSYTYAKPVENGTSKYNLSEEEAEAIEKAKLSIG